MTDLRIDFESSALQEALRRKPVELTRELSLTIGRIVLEMARTAKRHAPKATSQLVNSISSVQPNALEGLVFAGVAHAQAVEQGTGVFGVAVRPSGKTPPVQRIEDWIKVRRITPRDPKMDTRDLAWAIAQAIGRTGTPAQPFMRPAYVDHYASAVRRIQATIKRVLAS